MENLNPPEESDPRYEQFLRHIGAREQVGRAEAERLSAAVIDSLMLVLSAGETEDVEGELPAPLQRVLRRYHPGLRAERHRGRHDDPRRSSAEFLQAVSGRLREPLDRADGVSRAVFEALRLVLSPREIADVATALSAELRERWIGRPVPPPIPLTPPPAALVPVPEALEGYFDELRSSGLLGELPPEQATRAVLGLFLHRVSGGEAHRLLDELPEGMRELLGEEAPPRQAEAALFGRADLVRQVASRLIVSETRAETIIRSVFAATRLYCSESQAARISDQLPFELRAMWHRPGVPPLIAPEDFLDARLEELLVSVRTQLGCDEVFAWRATAHVMCALEKRLPGGEAFQLSEELPWRLREVMQVCRPPEESPAPGTGVRSFVQTVEQKLELDPERARQVIRAVFSAVRSAISLKEARDVSSALPTELKELWWE